MLRYIVADDEKMIREGVKVAPHTYWIILTGFSKFEYAKEGIKLGVADYLLKPIEPEELERAVKEISKRIAEHKLEKEDKKLIEQTKGLEERVDIIEQMKQYINEHYMEDISIATMANQYDMTTGYVSRIFHQKSGMKFIDYLIKVRMKNAKRIMELNITIPVKEVAEMVGYYNTRYFTKTFVKVYGYYPSDLKKNINTDK